LKFLSKIENTLLVTFIKNPHKKSIGQILKQ